MLAKATAEAEAEAVGRPALPGGDSMPSSASAGDIVPPGAVAAGAALECKFKLGDEVITKSGKQKGFIRWEAGRGHESLVEPMQGTLAHRPLRGA